MASTEESTQQQQTEEEESYQPLYTNSYDLCTDILKDIETLSSQVKDANRIIDVLLLHDGMKNGYFLMLLEMKLELLQHLIETGK